MAKTLNCFLLCAMLSSSMVLAAQSYHAFNGSAYAGVTAMYTNPGATVNQVYRWDVILFGLQASINNTAFVAHKTSVTDIAGATGTLTNGGGPRYLHNNADVNLLNARYAINGKNAVAIGLRLRSYNHFKAAPFNFNDTITTLQSFLHKNNNVNFFDGYVTHTGWGEININYARVMHKSYSAILSGGITLSYLKSFSGAYGIFSHINYIEFPKGGGQYFYILNQASASTAYSDNYLISAHNNSSNNLKNFISKAPSSFGFDIGAEYLLKNNAAEDGKQVSAANYDWKIGVSIMDIGHNTYHPIEGSLSINSPLDFADTTLQNKLRGVQNIRDIRDSLGSLFNNVTPLSNRFDISLPTRLIISVDHSLGSNFYVNTQASLNFYSTRPTPTLHTRETNLFTVTPRWETKAWGIYLPVQYNTQGLFWVGAAVKLGPLLLGVHNLDITKWFKKGDQTFNGGGYLMLSIHPFNRTRREPTEVDCPE